MKGSIDLKTRKYTTYLFSFLFSLLLIQTIVSADEPAYSCCGIIPSEEEAILDSTLPNTYSELPSSVNLSNDKYFPPIGQQVGGSCAAWATTYYQFTYEAARLMCTKDANSEGDDEWNPSEDPTKVYSPKYVWTLLNNGENTGVTLPDCHKVLNELGSVKWSQFPDGLPASNWYNTTSSTPLIDALKIRLSNSYYLKYSDQIFGTTNEPVITSSNDDNLTMMKSLLNQGHPIVISTNFSSDKDNNEDGIIDSPNVQQFNNGELGYTYVINNGVGHAMTIVGYDDNVGFDLDGVNGVDKDYEKGAFLLANSHGTESFNNGYIWILYDALNAVSNVDSLNDPSLNRCEAFWNSSYYYVEVEEYTNEIMVEVSIEQTVRNDFSISIGASSEDQNSANTKTTLIDAIGGNVGFNGWDSADAASRKFVFSYDDLYNTENDYYFLSVIDHCATNSADTIIKSVRWLDSNGNPIYINENQSSLSGDKINLVYSKLDNSDIITLNSSLDIYIDETYDINHNLALCGINKSNLSYISSNPEVATVDDSGIVTYISKGITYITVSSKANDNIYKNIRVNTYDEYPNTTDKAYTINLNDIINGGIDYAYDIDYFKFTAPSTEQFVFYTEGYLDSIINIYDENGFLVKSNDDYCQESYCSAIVVTLVENQTYYIKLSAYSGDDGNYTLFVQKANTGTLLCDVVPTQQYDHILIEGQFASIFDTLSLQLDDTALFFTVPEDMGTMVIEGEYTKCTIQFDFSRDQKFICWDISLYIYEGSSITTDSIQCVFLKANPQGEQIRATFNLL